MLSSGADDENYETHTEDDDAANHSYECFFEQYVMCFNIFAIFSLATVVVQINHPFMFQVPHAVFIFAQLMSSCE